MEELTMLDFDLDFAPDIYADILCAEIIDLDEKRVFEYSGCREFVITLSDNTVSEIYFNELFHRRATYPAYTFTSIKDKHRYPSRGHAGRKYNCGTVRRRLRLYQLCVACFGP